MLDFLRSKSLFLREMHSVLFGLSLLDLPDILLSDAPGEGKGLYSSKSGNFLYQS